MFNNTLTILNQCYIILQFILINFVYMISLCIRCAYELFLKLESDVVMKDSF